MLAWIRTFLYTGMILSQLIWNFILITPIHHPISRPAVNIFQWFRLKMVLQSWNLAQSYI